MDIKIGDLVTFKKGLYADEEGAIYRVLEINDDRCFLVFVNTDIPIPPQSVAILSELDLFVGRDDLPNTVYGADKFTRLDGEIKIS